MRRLVPLLALATLLGASLAGAAPQYKRSVLPSGLVVIAVQDASSPIAAVHLGVRVDVSSGRDSAAGVSALCQQVGQARLEALLKQPDWRPLLLETQSRGLLSLNTETDYCEARAQVTAEDLGLALQALVKALFDRAPVSADELAGARGVLAQAASRAAENAVEATYYEVLRALLGYNSPLAQPVMGTAEGLEALTAADVEAFRAAYLGPNNATLCVIGPQPCEELTVLATAAVADLPAATRTVTRAAAPLPALPRLAATTVPDWRGGSVMLAAPVGAYGSRSFITGQLVYEMLTGPQGRLRQAPLAASGLDNNRIFGTRDDDDPVSVIPPVPGPCPFLALHMVTQPRQIELARQVMLGQLLGFERTPPTAEELQRAKAQLLNAAALSQLSHVASAKALNGYELCGADVAQAGRLEGQLGEITPATVQALAHDWAEHHALGVVLPGDGTD